jgi:GT2 family glycosyltransferase
MTTKLPTVAVIVLNDNGLQFLDDCFSSLRLLDYPADCLEIVLADNGSIDGSKALARERFPWVRIIELGQNYGFSVANNRAAAEVDSDFVAFLNNDVRVQPGWLMGLVEALEGEPDAVCASAKMLTWDGSQIDFGGTLLSFLGHGRAAGYHDSDLAAYDDVRYILAPCGGAMLIDRRAFLDVGGFDEDFGLTFEDLDLGWRLWSLGHTVVFAPRAVCYHYHFATVGRRPPATMNYLYGRNALYTIIKNYEQRYLDRVLPLALLMHFKRVYLFAQMSGLDPNRARYQLGSAGTDATATAAVYGIRYYLREARKTLRVEGLTALMRKGLDEVDRRRGRPVPPRVVSPEAAIETLAFWQAMAELTAGNDVVDSLGNIMEKRADIQARRRRSDAQIFRKVRALSFGVCFDTAEYREAQQALIELLDIPSLFGEMYDLSVPFA